MVPEVIICRFNIYGARKINQFPQEFNLPHVSGSEMVYQIVAQVEHSGGLNGGHYWARGRREKNVVYRLNDLNTSPTTFEPSIGTYMIAYHLLSP
jgi:ubiquitin C-terminal hydrolase